MLLSVYIDTLYGNVVINKRPVYTSLSICKLHIVETFFRPQVKFFPELSILQPIQEIPYNSTELSYKTFALLRQ